MPRFLYKRGGGLGLRNVQKTSVRIGNGYIVAASGSVC